jgi:hypothetical protein
MNKLLNPVKYFQDKKLLTLNLLIFCIGTFIAITFNARFDGVLDLHFHPQRIPVQTMTDNIVDIIILGLMLFAIGKIINNKTRMIDCLNTAFYSRIPMYLLCFTNVGGISVKLSENVLSGTIQMFDYVLLITLAVLSITALIISVVILFKGFKVATNAKTTKHYVYFFVGLIVAEIISAILLKNL